jgi:hypothetical protein
MVDGVEWSGYLGRYPSYGRLGKRFRWRQDDLFHNCVKMNIRPLDQAGLPGKYVIFVPLNVECCARQTFHEEGYPVGSGTAEGEIEQFKAHLTGPEMR